MSSPSAKDKSQAQGGRSEEHTSELQSRSDLVCRLLLEKKKDMLFRTASETMLTIAADPLHLAARIGITAVLHTWGSAMTHRPYFFFIDPATTEIYTLSLHDALPI